MYYIISIKPKLSWTFDTLWCFRCKSISTLKQGIFKAKDFRDI